MFGYKLVKKKEYEMLLRCHQVDFRVAELKRWLNPWKVVYGNIFNYLSFGNGSVGQARENVLDDLRDFEKLGYDKRKDFIKGANK